jgi:hypothetical protein
MRHDRLVPVAVLVVALAALGASAAWALNRTDGWSMGGHHATARGWMMGYAAGGRHERVAGVEAARARAKAFADRLDLRTGEVLRFSSNYYVALVDGKGRPSTEVLVDPATGVVSLEYGPAMVWNTRYRMTSSHGARGMGAMMGRSRAAMMGDRSGAGMMGDAGAAVGMMGGGILGTATATSGTRALTLDQARVAAQRRLDADQAGVSVESSGGDAFPGYDTFETLRDGRIAGMVSVNATTGAVWPHWWHGRFVAEG